MNKMLALSLSLAMLSTLAGAASTDKFFAMNRVTPSLELLGLARATPSEDTFAVRLFTFSGNQHVENRKLLAPLIPYLNRPLTKNDLDNALVSLGEYYRTHGYADAKTYIQPQPIDSGVIMISVEEGSFDVAHVTAPKNNEAFVLSTLKQH